MCVTIKRESISRVRDPRIGIPLKYVEPTLNLFRSKMFPHDVSL
jgi:hypothetical protein